MASGQLVALWRSPSFWPGWPRRRLSGADVVRHPEFGRSTPGVGRRTLSLSEIKSEHIDGVIRQELVSAERVRRTLNGPWDRRVFVQGQMRAGAVVIVHVREQQVAQMSLAEHHDMIKTFPPDRTDQPFSMPILPWRSRRRWSVTNAHRANPSGEDLAIGPIPIANEYFGACSQPHASVSCRAIHSAVG